MSDIQSRSKGSYRDDRGNEVYRISPDQLLVGDRIYTRNARGIEEIGLVIDITPVPAGRCPITQPAGVTATVDTPSGTRREFFDGWTQAHFIAD